MTARPMVSLTYEYYRAVKSSSSCLVPKCGIREIQFHHVIPATKKDSVSNIARTGTIDELIAELEKCVPVCDQHHKDIHNGRRVGWLKGKFNGGQVTNDMSVAARYMPYKPFFTGLVPNTMEKE